MVLNRSKYGETYLLPFKYYYSQYKTRKEYTRFPNVLTQVGVKQLTDFLRTVTAASDLVDCTLVNCVLDDGQLPLCLMSNKIRNTKRRKIHLSNL